MSGALPLLPLYVFIACTGKALPIIIIIITYCNYVCISIYVENCALLGNYAASSGNILLEFRDNQSVLYTLKGGTVNNPEERE
jgi:hypothetical protein